MRTLALTGALVALAGVSSAQAAVDFKVQARCIAAYEVAASLLESDQSSAATKKRIAKLDAAREKTSLALATRTDLTPADARAGQQLIKSEGTRLDGLAPAAVQSAADDCDRQLGL